MSQDIHVVRRPLVASLALALIVGATLSACQSFENPFARKSAPTAELADPVDGPPPVANDVPPPDLGLALSPSQRFADVPLPQGATEDPEKTFVYEDKNVAVGRMVYTLRHDVNSIAQFYIRECPTTQWELKNNIQADGQQLLFVKPGKRLSVTVRDLGVTKGRQLVLVMTPEPAL